MSYHYGCRIHMDIMTGKNYCQFIGQFVPPEGVEGMGLKGVAEGDNYFSPLH